MRRYRAFLLIALALGSITVTPSLASRIHSVGLADMTSRAGRIFVGRCTGRTESIDPASRIPVTVYTFSVTDPIKGVGRGPATFRSPGTVEDPYIAGLPVFDVGDEALVFLYPESSAGFSTPIAAEQGRFVLHDGGGGSRVAVNGSGNDRLLVDVPEETLQRHLQGRHPAGPIDVARLTGIVRDLLAGGRP